MYKGEISCVIVGADRVAANGDVANKIGTYMLAVLAKQIICLLCRRSFSTIDLSINTGEEIIVEEREAREVTTLKEYLFPHPAPRQKPGF